MVRQQLTHGRSFNALTVPGCKEWHRWSSFLLINYIMYIIFSVGPPSPETRPNRTLLTYLDTLCSYGCYACEVFRSLCCWLWDFGDQVHHCWFCHERLPRLLDTPY